VFDVLQFLPDDADVILGTEVGELWKGFRGIYAEEWCFGLDDAFGKAVFCCWKWFFYCRRWW
jgi:hypothetical protein